MKEEIETEMYCLECGEIDKSHTAYCIKHGRSSHKIAFESKINDLQEAIKIYEGNGI